MSGFDVRGRIELVIALQQKPLPIAAGLIRAVEQVEHVARYISDLTLDPFEPIDPGERCPPEPWRRVFDHRCFMLAKESVSHPGIARPGNVLIEQPTPFLERLAASRPGETRVRLIGSPSEIAAQDGRAWSRLLDVSGRIKPVAALEQLDDRAAIESAFGVLDPIPIKKQQIVIEPGDPIEPLRQPFDREIDQPLFLPQRLSRSIGPDPDRARDHKRVIERQLDREQWSRFDRRPEPPVIRERPFITAGIKITGNQREHFSDFQRSKQFIVRRPERTEFETERFFRE